MVVRTAEQLVVLVKRGNADLILFPSPWPLFEVDPTTIPLIVGMMRSGSQCSVGLVRVGQRGRSLKETRSQTLWLQLYVPLANGTVQPSGLVAV